MNQPKKVGCSKCRYKGCRSCRGYTLKEQARFKEEWGAKGLGGDPVVSGDEEIPNADPRTVDVDAGAEVEHGAVGCNESERVAGVTVGTEEPEIESPTTYSNSIKTRTRSKLHVGSRSETGDASKKRPLTPERFLNPPKEIGCPKCRYKGCTRCRGYTLSEGKRWKEEHGSACPKTAERRLALDTACARKTGDHGGLDAKGSTAHAAISRAQELMDSKTPAVTNERRERPDDLSPGEFDEPVKGAWAAPALVGPAAGSSPVHASGMGQQPMPILCQEDKLTRADAKPEMEEMKAAIVVPESGVERRAARDGDETWWDPLDDAVVRQAKGCLHVSYTGMTGLPSCRDQQVQEISDWLNSCVQNTRGDSLYLSGVPGTGKTLAANAIVRGTIRGMQVSLLPPPVALSINCMRVETAKDVLCRIVAGFRTAALQTITGRLGDDPLVHVPENEESIVNEGTWADLSPEEHLRKIVQHPIMTKEQLAATAGKKRRSSVTESDLVKQTGLIFLILDEIDGMLGGRNCEEIMGSLLALASSEGSRLVIIGIANSIDLMQQLTRPGAVFHRFNLKPKNIIFPTYLREQVSQLLQERLDTLPGPVIDPKAIQFCARKIANGTGDMRRALEAASLSIDVLVKDATHASAEAEVKTLTDGPSAPAGNAGNAGVKRMVGMRQMGVALNKLSGGVGSSNEHVRAIKKLPVPQQLIMCALSAMVGESFKARGIEERAVGSRDGQMLMGMKISHNLVSLPTYRPPESGSATSKPPTAQVVTLADIEQGQRSLCTSIGVEKYTPSEFSTAIEVLKTMGLIQLSGKKATDMRRSRVQLKISEDDVWLALSDIPILKNILTKK